MFKLLSCDAVDLIEKQRLINLYSLKGSSDPEEMYFVKTLREDVGLFEAPGVWCWWPGRQCRHMVQH